MPFRGHFSAKSNVTTLIFTDEMSKRIYGSTSLKQASKNNVLTYKKRRFQLAKRGSKEERETIIRFDETDDPAVIYTFNADLKKRLKSFSKKHPELCIMTVEETGLDRKSVV